jgi:hypothetical protein
MFKASSLAFALLLIATTLAAAGSIPVTVDRYLPDARGLAPVKFGVPFAPGMLKPDEAVAVVDDQGAAVVSQSHVLATWNPAGDRGVRWLLVDFLADPQRRYWIVFGSDLPAAATEPVAAVAVVSGGGGGDAITINTGPLRGSISTKKFDLFTGLTAMGQPLAQRGAADAAAWSGFYVEHEKRGLFRSDLDPAPRVVLEETGPIRATLKADGWYCNEAGEKFGRYSIRAHFFRGRSDIRLDHTFIYTGKSVDDKIVSMGMQTPRPSGQRGYIGGEGLLPPLVANDFTSTAKVIQDSPDHRQLELLQELPGGRMLRVADRASGWLTYGSFKAAIRDAWQQYPYGFDVRDGVVRVELWPRGERLLDTTFDGYWWYLTEHQKRFMLANKPKAPADTDAWLARFRQINATGAAKTHELWLSFDAPPPQQATGQQLAREVAYPTLAYADLHYATATRALDYCPHTPRNPQLFGQEENHLTAVLTMVNDLTEQGHWYGWWGWGGYYQLPGARQSARFKDSGGEDAWHRNRPKSHYGWGQLPWQQFHRTGDRRWLRYAQTYTLYSADRAHVHHTDHGRFTGEEYHYDHSDIPWVGGYQGSPGGAQLSSNLQQKDDYVYMYWLTGDRRALDVLQEWGELVADKPGAFKWEPGMALGNDIRNSGMQLHRLSMLYQATWDERYLKLARIVADAYAPITTPAEVAISENDRKNLGANRDLPFHTANGWAIEGLWQYYQCSGDERLGVVLKAFIERARDYDGGIGWGYGPIRPMTFGWLLTGDESYLDLVRGICDDIISAGLTPRTWSPDSAKFTISALGRALGAMAEAPSAWRERNLPTHARGGTLRFRYWPYADSPAYAASHIVFRESDDRDWSFRLLFSHGGRWTLTRPDGSVAFESPLAESPFDQKQLLMAVKADGQRGDYTLRCVEPSAWYRANRRPDYLAEAKVIRSDLPLVAAVPRTLDVLLGVRGRSLCFTPTAAGAARVVPTVVGRATELWSGNQRLAATTDFVPPASGIYPLAFEADQVGRVLELRYDVRPDQWFGDGNTTAAPLRYLELQGASPYVAANPENYFVPQGK